MDTNIPPPQATYTPSNNDAEHVRLLSLFHYVYAGFAAVFGCIPILHIAFGIAFMNDAIPIENIPNDGRNDAQVEDLKSIAGMVIVGMGSAFVALGWTFAILVAVAGRKLAVRRGRTYCIVIAALSCMVFPLGTILGVFTLIVLMRPSVQAMFEAPERMQPW